MANVSNVLVGLQDVYPAGSHVSNVVDAQQSVFPSPPYVSNVVTGQEYAPLPFFPSATLFDTIGILENPDGASSIFFDIRSAAVTLEASSIFFDTRGAAITPEASATFFDIRGVEFSYTGPTTGIAKFPPPQTFGGVSHGKRPVILPGNHFGPPSEGRTLVAPFNVFGPPTSGRASSIIPPFHFGGTTGGVVEGIPTPINLTATVIDAGCVRLDWIDPSDEETGYRVERSLADADDWDVIATLPENTETFLDRFAVPLVVYDYRVIGFDPVRQSLPSNIATAVTPLPPNINTGPPPSTPQDPQRNRIQPKPFSFDSPGVYGLEKDENGDVTGFKF